MRRTPPYLRKIFLVLDPDPDDDDPEEGSQDESNGTADNGNPWLGNPDGDDLIIAYVRGEPVIGIFKPEQTPLAEEYFGPRIGYSRSEKWINRIIKAQGSARYCHGQSVWIRAKTSVSQTLEHANGKDKSETRKSLDELLPGPYQEYRRLFKKRHRNSSPSRDPGIMQSISNRTSSRKTARSTPSPPPSRRNSTSSLTTTYRKDTSDPRSHPWPPPFSCVQKGCRRIATLPGLPVLKRWHDQE